MSLSSTAMSVYAMVSTKSLYISVVSVSKYVSPVAAAVTTSDKTSAAKEEFGSLTETSEIYSIIVPTESASELVITLANIMAPSSLLAAL